MAHVPDDTHDIILLYYATQHNQIMQPIEASLATRLNLWRSKCDGCINRQRQEETVIHSKAPTIEDLNPGSLDLKLKYDCSTLMIRQ